MLRDRAIGMVDISFLRKSIEAALGIDVEPFGLDPMDVVIWCGYSAQRAGRVFHRLYWYDAQYDSSHNAYQAQRKAFSEVARTPGLRLRLGTLVSRSTAWHTPLKKALAECGVDIDEFKKRFQFKVNYEQKGVDTLLVLDMLRLAQMQAYETLILIAGDSDFAEAVRAVQDMGRRVILAYPKGAGVGPQLLELADEAVRLEEVQLRRMLKSKPGLQSFAMGNDTVNSDEVSRTANDESA